MSSTRREVPLAEGRVPRLDAVCAIAGGTTAFITAELASTADTIRVSYEALLAGVLIGAVVGWGIRQWLVREPHEASPSRRWLPILGTWLAGGLLASALVAVGTHMKKYGAVDSFTLEAFGVGALGSALSLPASAWLAAKARASRRARYGSLVAAHDNRAIIGALMVCVAFESLLLVPQWRDSFYGAAPPPIPAMLGAMAALVVSGVLVWLDSRAARTVIRVLGEVETLDEIGAGSQRTPAVTDIGVGKEIYGREEAGRGYRSTKQRVPLVRGSPEHAAAILQRSLRVSWLRLIVMVIPTLVHLYEVTHPPTDSFPSMGDSTFEELAT